MKALLRSIDGLVAFDHCRILLPWFSYARATGDFAGLRRRALLVGRADALTPSLALIGVAAVLHALRASFQSLQALRRLGAACKSRYGVGLCRQFLGGFYCAFRHNLWPEHYQVFRLHERPLTDWALFLSHEELTRLLILVRETPGLRNIWTKQSWLAFCEQHGLPTVGILARADKGLVSWARGAQTLSGRDLFLKPDEDFSGRGGVLLEWDASRFGWSTAGAHVCWIPAGGLDAFLCDYSSSRPGCHILQARLLNAGVFGSFGCRALVNTRVVTSRLPDGGIAPICAALRCPPGDQVSSDVPGRTILIPIDLRTGRLGCLRGPDLASSEQPAFPGKPVRVEGLFFPDWDAAVALLRRAHSLLPEQPCVGWDLVYTDQGLLLLEANAVWNGRLGQLYGQSPLGAGPVPAALASFLGLTSSSLSS